MSKLSASTLLKRAAFVGLVGFGASQAGAALITFDVIASSINTGPGVIADAGKTVTGVAVGTKIQYQVWARIADGDHATVGWNNNGTNPPTPVPNDLIWQVHGSLKTGVANLLGNVNNAAVQDPFKGAGYNNGVQANLDGDTDMDWGSLAQTGDIPSPNPWIMASSGGSAAGFTTAYDVNNARFPSTTGYKIAQGIFQVTATTGNDGTQLSWVPRIKTDGNTEQQNMQIFQKDGLMQYLPGSSPEIATSPLQIGVVPEPAAVGLLALGAIGLLAKRRR